MKVIVNFGEKKVVVPCGPDGDLLIRELIQLATAKYRKLSLYNDVSTLNSDQIQLRLNNGAVVDPDDRVCDVADDREELFTVIDSSSKALNSNGELSSSMTSSNLSTSLSDHERPAVPPPLLPKPSLNHRHEVIVTDADLRTRSLRIKTESANPPVEKNEMYDVYRDEKTGDQIFTIVLPRENSPLGIHVIPYNSNENQVNGLVLQNIESDGRIKRQGILEVNDRIIEINRINIEQCSFEKAQLIFRNALLEPELELRIVRNVKKSSPPFPMPNVHEHNPASKRLGKIFKITLVKGVDGLGFKLASRDNPTGVANPIYVKTIFPKGAAIEDGRLQNGDRLLMVNSVDVTQMSLQETVGLLRETRIGDTVHLCVSRQHDGSLPKDLLTDEVKTQIMTFDIPLRDTSSAGLGITLKGKTSIIDGQSMDLGIFVKSVLTGGAAYRDNRLRPNDQILIINNSSLVNLTNLEAANILHDAVRKEIQPGYIKITISRAEQNQNSKNVREVELLPPSNEENELDLTNFVPTVSRKTPVRDLENRTQTPVRMKVTLSEKQNQEEVHNRTPNPFDRETPFRQSISEKRRLNQQSFHETRTNSERRHPPTRLSTNSTANMTRSTSYESISQMTKENDERKRQIKSRHRACNDSFRQAVDRSYNKNNYNETIDGDRPVKAEKSRFKFANLFTAKSKRKENQEEKSFSSSIKTIITPPPPSPFSSQQDFAVPKPPNTERKSSNVPDGQPLSYQPYRFDVSNRASSTVHHQKSTHPPIPRQFLQANITGTQSLKQHHLTSRPSYPSNQRLAADSYAQLENPANV